MPVWTDKSRKEEKEKQNESFKDKTYVDDSKIKGAGLGLFAKIALPKGVPIGRYWGRTIDVKTEDGEDELERMFPENKDILRYAIRLDAHRYIDASNPAWSTDARYANDANFKGGGKTKLQNNAHFEKYGHDKKLYLVPTCLIKPGEEILADYKYGDDTKALYAPPSITLDTQEGVEVRESEAVPGESGLFATQDFKYGAFIVEYLGEPLSYAVAKERGDNTYQAKLNSKIIIDAIDTPEHLGRYANRAKKGEPNNCGFRYRAKRDGREECLILQCTNPIRKGQEISCAYNRKLVQDIPPPAAVISAGKKTEEESDEEEAPKWTTLKGRFL
jgi:hypothetical protein